MNDEKKINTLRPLQGAGRKLFVETYGCQMNVGDTEIVVAIMQQEGYVYTDKIEEADVVLINTCSIRDNAEQRIWGRLREMAHLRRRRPGVLVGIIGCMAERLRERLLEGENPVDIVTGPDAYRDLPRLVREAGEGGRGVNVLLSREETYAEIAPVRLDRNGVSGYIAIMRGCNNYWLGQNVNSYRYGAVDFPELMRLVAEISPLLRVRFATSHPKDMSDRLLEVMASKPNICRCIHLPAQSGSSRMLEKMNRKYTREWYLDRIAAIRRYMPDCAITTDLIAGFCSETDEDHRQTLSLMREVGYEFAYMFKYSERPDTFAQRHMPDDVPDSVKTARLNEIIALQNTLSAESNARDVGKEFEILVEGTSKRSDRQLFGRTSQNKVVVFDRGECRIGDYVRVRVTASSSATLQGELVERTRPFEV